MLDTKPREEGERNRLTNAALALLVRRDHSRGELCERLSRSSDSALVEEVLDHLADQGLQSDERFCESFVRYRIDQGKGPAKIRQDLRQKHVSSDFIDRALDRESEFWVQRAQQTYQQKYKGVAIADAKEKARRLRFMVSRGFSAAMVFPLMETDD